jgi:hypothetical protein
VLVLGVLSGVGWCEIKPVGARVGEGVATTTIVTFSKIGSPNCRLVLAVIVELPKVGSAQQYRGGGEGGGGWTVPFATHSERKVVTKESVVIAESCSSNDASISSGSE